jgi:rhodanese-related sulfurtransferase
MQNTISPDQLNQLMETKQEVMILDVRRKSDFEADTRMIPGALWRDPEQVEEWSKTLPKEQQIVIYCVRGGSVSKSVSEQLMGKNLKVSYIEGGIAAWKESGGKVGTNQGSSPE